MKNSIFIRLFIFSFYIFIFKFFLFLLMSYLNYYNFWIFTFYLFFFKKMLPTKILGLLLIINIFLIFITVDNQLVYDTKLYHLQTVKYHSKL